jgi:hypothetical protein
MDLGLNAGHDSFGDLFLDDKDIGDLAVVTLREQVVAGRRFDELHRDTVAPLFQRVGDQLRITRRN